MPQSPTCRHHHTQLIAKDNEAEYLECLDCGAILEAGEIPADSTSAADESAAAGSTDAGPQKTATAAGESIDESLSDA